MQVRIAKDVGRNYSMKKLSFKKLLKNQYVSGLIVGIVLFILSNSIPLLKSLISDQSLSETFSSFWRYKVELWLVLLCIFIILLISLLINSIRLRKTFKYDDDSIILDKKLFNIIREKYLTQDGTIYWLRTHHFGGSFSDKIHTPLFEIQEVSFQSDFEFLNPILESLKNELIEDIKNFNSLIVNQTFRHGPNSQAVPSEWFHEQPDRYNKVVNELNDLADIICEKYDKFIRYGRRTLKI